MQGLQSQRLLPRHKPFSSPVQQCRTAGPPRTSRPSAAAATAAAGTQPELAAQNPLDNLFQDLCSHFGITSSVLLKQSDGGSGLFAIEPIAKGNTILRVPRSICIIIDNEAGSMTIPPGGWPRLSGGLMQPGEPLTWDLLQGLAMMDATAGDGDQFWELYAEQLLPQPELLTLPMCWTPELLQELQHPAIIQAALQQQERLRGLFPPEYMTPIDDGLPSYLQWGFACVRSRACQVGPQAFGMVPFVDLANHSPHPNADVRASPPAVTPEPSSSTNSSSSSTSSSSASLTAAAQTSDFIDLVAVRDVAAGDEVTITYSGPAGFSNQRCMSQYGFVPAGGNPDDRLALAVPQELSGVKLRMSHVEEALGATLIMEAARGKNPYIFAALKSLPLLDDEPAAADGPAAAAAASAGSISGRGMGPATEDERRLANALLQQVSGELAACSSSLQEDDALLERLQRLQQQPGDVLLAAAVRYRVERKRLLAAAQVLLGTFTRG